MEPCILVATDGDDSAQGALRAAHDVGRRLGLPLEIVSVCEPDGAAGFTPVEMLAGVMPAITQRASAARRAHVEGQLAAAGIDGMPAIHVEVGAPAAVIARMARERRARLIVLGKGRQAALDRMLGDETALRVIQSAHLPVLSAPVDYAGLPGRTVAAVDFTTYSVDAARTAAALVAAGGELHLVHVEVDSSSVDPASWRDSEWLRANHQEMEGRLARLAEELAMRHPEIVVRTHLAAGRPVPTILRLAGDLEAEMLAAGTSGYGFLGRLLLGSVATQLVRRTRCMTLIAPPRGVVAAAGRGLSRPNRNEFFLTPHAAAVAARQSL